MFVSSVCLKLLSHAFNSECEAMWKWFALTIVCCVMSVALASSSAGGRRQQKRQRILDLVSVAHVPARNLANIIDHLRNNPAVLQEATRKTIETTYNAVFEQVAAPPFTLPLTKGGEFQWETIDFGKGLDCLAAESPEFKGLLSHVHRSKRPTPSDPWHLVFYSDESTPGDPLRLDHRKKTMNVYASIKEFGPGILKHECAWVPIAVLRTNILKHVPCGWSRCVKIKLQQMFTGDGNLRLGFSLVCLDLEIISITLGNIIADEACLQCIWSIKGYSGTMPCMECFNVSNVGAKSIVDASDPHGFIVDISCTDIRRFRRKKNVDVWEQMDKLILQKGVLGVGAFESLQQEYGMNYNPDGLLAAKDLRAICPPIDVQTHDPCHVVFANGIAAKELTMMVGKLINTGVKFADLDAYVNGSGWKEPGSQPNKKIDVFRHPRIGKWDNQKSLSYFASGIMLVVPLLLLR